MLLGNIRRLSNAWPADLGGYHGNKFSYMVYQVDNHVAFIYYFVLVFEQSLSADLSTEEIFIGQSVDTPAQVISLSKRLRALFCLPNS